MANKGWNALKTTNNKKMEQSSARTNDFYGQNKAQKAGKAIATAKSLPSNQKGKHNKATTPKSAFGIDNKSDVATLKNSKKK